MGQIVQFVKAGLSRECPYAFCDNDGMSADDTEREWNAAFCARVGDLRRERFRSAEQMATALNLPVERYRKYETRTPLPPYLHERFALIVGVSVHYLLTGQNEPRVLHDHVVTKRA